MSAEVWRSWAKDTRTGMARSTPTLVFANKHLAEICRQAGVPFVEWRTFDDVRAGLESAAEPPGGLNPALCPGWTIPAESSGPDIAPK
jgi:hypothetical protein